MPRLIPFRFTLSRSARTALVAIARRYTSSYRDVIRAKIVLMAAEGLENEGIAARLDTSRQIVSKWRKRFCERGVAGLSDLARGGRPRRQEKRRSRNDRR